MDDLKLYSLDEVCRILRVCRSTGLKLRDKIPGALKIGNRYFYPEEGIKQFISSCEVK
jgi:hypothetical protein